MKNMKHTCPACNNTVQLPQYFKFETFVCPSCSQLSYGTDFPDAEKSMDTDYKSAKRHYIALRIGAVGQISGVKHQVTGILIKEAEDITWAEYSLHDISNNHNKVKYLVEYDGDWSVLEEVSPTSAYYEDFVKANFKAYYAEELHYSKATLVTAKGFFDHAISRQPYQLTDYNSRNTYLISVEQHAESTDFFKGYAISANKAKEFFPTINFPGTTFYYGVEPGLLPRTMLITIFLVLAMLLLLTNMGINSYKTEHSYTMYIPMDSTMISEQISEPFTIEKPTTLQLKSHCPLSQEWLYTSIALVNRQTNEVRYTEQEMEYYFSTDYRDPWTEGSHDKTLTLCCIPAGTYHLAVVGERSSTEPRNMTIEAHWNYGSYSNFWRFTLIFLPLGLIIAFFLHLWLDIIPKKYTLQ
ncbi:MAG: DUF4178 domain-containing protein [Chitinophagales bacterium]|nr:DUF4178 domain-containing protein [Chitinophagales bacterium]